MTSQIDYFQHELHAIRQSVEDFSNAYPAAASELRLSSGHSADPHVEQLLQSFAWLTGSLRADLHQQRQEIPNHLLLSLYPHLMHSIPSMTVMQANVLADGANYVNGYSLQKGRLFSIWSHQHKGIDGNEKKPVECRMQCCYDTPLWPLRIDDIAVKPKNVFTFLDDEKDIKSIISIKLSSYGTDPIYEYPLSKIRFFIADSHLRKNLHNLLSNNLCTIFIGHHGNFKKLSTSANIDWLGFADGHNILPQPLGTHNAYRLLLEYFYFPEKFYFFDLSGLEVDGITDEFEVLLTLTTTNKLNGLNKNSLKINSFPAINLFPATFKPIQLDHSHYEYRLIADESQYGQSEVHSLTQVRLLSANGKVRHAEPWLGGTTADIDSHIETLSACDITYLTRLVAPITAGRAGCDTMIALYDATLSPAQPIDKTLSAKGLCSNRELPESLRVGNSLKLLGAGAMVDAHIISKPSLFKGAKLDGAATVKLLSQLHLNQLSLFTENIHQQALVRPKFKQLLDLYCDPMSAPQRCQIDSITGIATAVSVRRMGADAWRGHYRGTLVKITIDERGFDKANANALLFGEVLSHFLGMYTTLNHFVQLQFFSDQREGEWQLWPPRIGEQIIV
ncbi:MAG: type VI secretion system baseplate subunit TssF [Cellvibrionaceae bacterium]|nr:type VI secretion system baseplate subunit TssF [Cellvibrionaceae bacterium]